MQKQEPTKEELKLQAEAEELKELKNAILVFRRFVDNYGILPRAGNSGHSKKMQDALINATSHFQRAIDDAERKHNPRRPWWARIDERDVVAQQELDEFEELLRAYGGDDDDEGTWEIEEEEIPL